MKDIFNQRMKLLSLLIISLFACTMSRAQAIVTPTAQQAKWADYEIGVLIHFDMPVFCPEYKADEFGTNPPASVFNPSNLNTDQWIKAAKALGAKYAILVAKHCSGFSLWPTKAHEYSVKNSPWKNGKGDLVADFIRSCKKYGLKPGIYASTAFNGYLHVTNHKIDPKGPVTQKQYNDIVKTQLTELWTNYGPLAEIWFDGGVLDVDKGGLAITPMLKRLQPQAIAFQGPYDYNNLVRWVGNEEGMAPYPCWATSNIDLKADGTLVYDNLNGSPNAKKWNAGESDFTLRWNNTFQGGWFWHEGDDDKIFTVDQLMKKYENSVGHNTNMLLGVVIDKRGLVPDADAKRLAAFGQAIKAKYGHPLKTVKGTGNKVLMNFNRPTKISRVVLQEDIRYGERVLSFQIEGKTASGWTTLYKGTNIGHKHIALLDATEVKAIRLHVLKAKLTPIIRAISVY
jgi:alpha-L-fucosidase